MRKPRGGFGVLNVGLVSFFMRVFYLSMFFFFEKRYHFYYLIVDTKDEMECGENQRAVFFFFLEKDVCMDMYVVHEMGIHKKKQCIKTKKKKISWIILIGVFGLSLTL